VDKAVQRIKDARDDRAHGRGPKSRDARLQARQLGNTTCAAFDQAARRLVGASEVPRRHAITILLLAILALPKWLARSCTAGRR
jgi:hypothetical protein